MVVMRKHILFIMIITLLACHTATIKEKEDPFAQDNKKFLEEKSGTELFRVLITPDSYQVVQYIIRIESHVIMMKVVISIYLKRWHSIIEIDEAREGHSNMWLFPD